MIMEVVIPLFEVLPNGIVVQVDDQGGVFISRWIQIYYPHGVPNKILRYIPRN